MPPPAGDDVVLLYFTEMMVGIITIFFLWTALQSPGVCPNSATLCPPNVKTVLCCLHDVPSSLW